MTPVRRAFGGVTLRPIVQSHFRGPTFGVVEGGLGPLLTHASDGGFVVAHESATFLVDAGLCSDAHTRHMPSLPAVNRALLRRRPDVGFAHALTDAGVDPASLSFAILTHLHWDHCSGLADLPPMPALVSAAEDEFGKSSPHRLSRHAVVARAFSDADLQPVKLDGPPVETFEASYDVFGDGAVLIVSLPGHTPGHVGVLLTLKSGARVLLAGDAVWSTQQVRAGRQRPPTARCLVDFDEEEAFRSVLRLHKLSRDITILPTHDAIAISRFQSEANRLQAR